MQHHAQQRALRCVPRVCVRRGRRRADAKKILDDLEARATKQYVSSFGIAVIHDALGDKERAMAALEQAYQDHAVEFSQLGQYPPFRSLSGTPRYEEIMKIVSRPR